MDSRIHEAGAFLIEHKAHLALLQKPILGKKGSGKAPTEKNWQNKKVGMPELYHWMTFYPDHNIGMLTGSPSNFIVVDIDGDEGLERYYEIAGKREFDTVTVKTPSGGFHLYYKIPMKYQGKKLRKSFDRGKEPHNECAFLGDGQQVVIPYSTHYSGGIYDFLEGHAPIDMPFKDAPEQIISRMVVEEQDE